MIVVVAADDGPDVDDDCGVDVWLVYCEVVGDDFSGVVVDGCKTDTAVDVPEIDEDVSEDGDNDVDIVGNSELLGVVWLVDRDCVGDDISEVGVSDEVTIGEIELNEGVNVVEVCRVVADGVFVLDIVKIGGDDNDDETVVDPGLIDGVDVVEIVVYVDTVVIGVVVLV